MGRHDWWNCIWEMSLVDVDGTVLSTERKQNALVNEGERAVIESFLRGGEASVFTETNFFIGLYSGTIGLTTTLLTVPGEPNSAGYSRQEVGRNFAGWPTIELDNGYYRAVSEMVTFQATGGDITNISGAFLATSSDNLGSLICAVASSVERTILSGQKMSLSMRVKCK